MEEQEWLAERFEENRARLRAVTYRMIGSADGAADGLIHVVFNTLFNLLTQEDQVRCFENVAAHLTDDGSFVVEA